MINKRLGVNIDHVATIRNARGVNYPNPLRAAIVAEKSVALDIKEGADFVMVKPGMPYLDIIRLVKENFKIPVFAYQVSGEYSMIKKSVEEKIISKESIKESLMSFKRAGASAIVTYFADEIANNLK